MTAYQILDLEMDPQRNDAGASTIREYYKTLLKTLLETGEGFSGKRPLGNSDWEYQLYEALVKGGAIQGTLNEDGFVEEIDRYHANALLRSAVNAL
jgi:hypothetical protein